MNCSKYSKSIDKIKAAFHNAAISFEFERIVLQYSAKLIMPLHADKLLLQVVSLYSSILSFAVEMQVEINRGGRSGGCRDYYASSSLLNCSFNSSRVG